MKFINYLESITGVGIYPLVSLIIFFTFFLAVGVYVVKGRKEYFNYLKNLPINQNQDQL
ncbi:MAG TPA: CcoQ/FixQ family Cbb3-type cytochrome c oxidase assembly chaperone [Bacteroidia bacterium]|jgi:cbb3-type cytochrome oxidase subunit 3|nr:CcoQ/FixQ family Cbb3-type cytochrome c oxidase assembly chaperone [Bacteroidia bacterium]